MEVDIISVTNFLFYSVTTIILIYGKGRATRRLFLYGLSMTEKKNIKEGIKHETYNYICGISGFKSYLQGNKSCKRVRLWCAYFY